MMDTANWPSQVRSRLGLWSESAARQWPGELNWNGPIQAPNSWSARSEAGLGLDPRDRQGPSRRDNICAPLPQFMTRRAAARTFICVTSRLPAAAGSPLGRLGGGRPNCMRPAGRLTKFAQRPPPMDKQLAGDGRADVGRL